MFDYEMATSVAGSRGKDGTRPGLMCLDGLMAIYQKPRSSASHSEHEHYPYLSRDLVTPGPIRFVWTSLISPCRKVFCKYTILWIGTAKRCCFGDCPTPWTQIFVSLLWKKTWRNTVIPIYSTPTRAVSSPGLLLPKNSGKNVSEFLWTVMTTGWVTCSLNASGEVSSMRASPVCL